MAESSRGPPYADESINNVGGALYNDVNDKAHTLPYQVYMLLYIIIYYRDEERERG